MIDFLTPFYEKEHTPDGLLTEMGGVLQAHDLAARALPFYADTHPNQWLHRSGTARMEISLLREGSGASLYHFVAHGRGRDGEESTFDGRFFIYHHPTFPNTHALLTLESGEHFVRLRRLVANLYPRAISTFITHRTLRQLLEDFRDSSGMSRLVIKRVSLRERYEPEGERSREIPYVSWPDMELGDAFDLADEHNAWFQSLQFDAYGRDQAVTTVWLDRQGAIRTTRRFAAVFSAFVQPVCRIMRRNADLFARRSRRDTVDLSVRPLTVDFDGEQVGSMDQHRRFVEAMRGLPSASVSVLHDNPHVHLSVLDYYDGSTFDMWILSGSQITIVPQMKSTVGAIHRLIHHIFDSFGEGRITDWSRAT